MTLKDELNEYVKKTHENTWKRRDGLQVPDAADVQLGTDAVDLEATVLYADLADSSALVKGWKDWFAAEVYKNYLYCAAKIIRKNDGIITAYDGDRIMAVYLGGQKNSNAAKTGLQIKWAVDNILKPAIQAKYPKNTYVLKQKVGIDTSRLMVARTGIRGSNDLVWVGKSANAAAKLAALGTNYQTYISSGVYNVLLDWAKQGGEPKRNMWTDLGDVQGLGRVYGSTWYWSF